MAAPPANSSLLAALSVRRVSRGADGYVACIDLVARDLNELVTSVKRFAQTWDLSEIGALRYVYARRSEARADQTLVLTVWADSSLNLRSLIASSDAEGEDLPGVPVPEGSRRVFSAHERGRPSRVAVYVAPGLNPLHLLRQYRRRFAAHGWTIIERHPTEIVEVDGTLLLAAERPDRMVTILARIGEHGTTTLILLEAEAL